MKTSVRYILMSLVVLFGITAPEAFAGNEDRSGQAGASELLINPWAASAGWGNAGMSFVSGTEAMWGNVAGITSVKRLDVNFTHTDWLVGSSTQVSAFGFVARVGESNALGLSLMSFNNGSIVKTTVDSPDGGLGTYTPNLMNINLSFAREFSNSIKGGFNLKVISESIDNMSASGFALDAGIQYVSGPFDNIHFGITLKNIGATMRMSGDGLTYKAFLQSLAGSNQFTVIQRADQFELPTQLSIAAAYDWHFESPYRLTVAANFNSNSFTRDQFTLGGEFGWKELLLLRVGYTYEKGIWKGFEDPDCLNLNKGLSAGLSVQVPLSKDEDASKIAIDYAFRQTENYLGTHSVGIRLIF